MSTDPDTESDGPIAESGLLWTVVRTIVPNVVRRSFAVKFALVLLLMGAIVVGIGFTATETLSTQVEDDVRSEYRRLADQQASIVEKWLERNAVSTRLAAQNQALAANPSGDVVLSNELSDTWGSLYGAHQIHLVSTASGRPEFLASTADLQRGVAVSNTARQPVSGVNLHVMDDDSVSVSSVYRVSGTPVVAFVSPIDGSLGRYLVIEYRVSELSTLLENSAAQSGQHSDHFTQVVNTAGRVQVASDEEEITSRYGDVETIRHATRIQQADDAANATDRQRNVPKLTYFLERQQESELEHTVGFRTRPAQDNVMDQHYAVGYASIRVADIASEWVVVTHAPTSDLFGFVRRVSIWGRIATLASMLLIGVVGASMGYSTATTIDRLRRKAEAIEDGDLDVEIHSNRIDSIGRLYDSFGNMRDALRGQIREAEQARKEAEVSRAEAMEMNRYLEEKAEQYSRIMERCAAGDLTRRMDADGESDAMDRIAAEFNDMIAELEKTTGQLKRFADEVETASDVVQQSSGSVQTAAEQVAESIQRISDDAYEQKDRLQEVSEEMDVLADQLEAFAADHPDVDFADQLEQIDDVTTTITEVVELAEQTLEESEHVAGAAEEQAAELTEVSQRAADLIRYARPLDDVLSRFETQSEHEFYFPVGPGSEQEPPSVRHEDDD